MSLNNVRNNICKKLLIAIGLLMATLPVQASVVYNFTSAPISVRALLDPAGNEVQTIGPFDIGDPQTASLTFESPLAPNSRTQLSSESGGFDFIGEPNQGGLTGYSAPGFPIPITSDIRPYTASDDGTMLSVFRYSSLEGDVTTDERGNISSWDLAFTLFDRPSLDPTDPGGFVIDRDMNTMTPIGGNVDALLSISSDPAEPLTITDVVALNGVDARRDVNGDGIPDPISYDFDQRDSAFRDPGFGYQVTFYTEQPGSFEPINQVPSPGTLPLLMLPLVGWALFANNGRNWQQLMSAPKLAVVGRRSWAKTSENFT